MIVNVKGDKGSAIARPVSQGHLGEVSRQVSMTMMDDRLGKEAEVQNDVTDGRWSTR